MKQFIGISIIASFIFSACTGGDIIEVVQPGDGEDTNVLTLTYTIPDATTGTRADLSYVEATGTESTVDGLHLLFFNPDDHGNGTFVATASATLKDASLSPRVVRGVHTLLHNCLEQAVAERLILSNPAQGCKLPQLEKKEMKILPQEKIGMYLAEAERRGLLAAFYLELTTGLRRGELLALLWTDLDVENRTISITKQVTRTKGELVVSQPKTHNSIRVLPVSQQAVDLLVEEHKKHLGNPHMFPSPKTGGMFDPDSFRHTHKKILKTIGAEHIRFHDLRHTFATLSLKNGVDVKTLSSTLGHYSAGFTLSTYTHATPDMMREAADTMGDVIGKAI